MFVYLRYFYIASIILIVVGGFLIGFYIRSITTTGLTELVQQNDKLIAQQFVRDVWRPYETRLRSDRAIAQTILRKEAVQFTQNLPKLRLSLLSHDGRVIFRSVVDKIANDKDDDIYMFPNGEGLKQTTQSHIIVDTNHSRNGEIRGRPTVVQTLIPIRNPGYTPDAAICKREVPDNFRLPDICLPFTGVIEMVSDITPQWKQLLYLQIVTASSIIGMFIILITILFFVTYRAESIIAKQHELNLELTAAAASAEAENQEKSQFLANISHELRTPLNAIIGFSEIIKKESITALQPAHQEYIHDIHNSGKHLLSLINDILDYSKAEAGKLEIDLSEIDLNKLLINSMRLVIPRAEEANVTLIENLPKEHLICETDAKKLKQVLLNLLSNAVKFTPAGGEVRISAWNKLNENAVCIEVRDTGIGIAPKDIAKVMTPFGQVDNKLSRRYEGTGLGLPLSKKFIEIMGGVFEIESDVNQGTTILITLPMPKHE